MVPVTEVRQVPQTVRRIARGSFADNGCLSNAAGNLTSRVSNGCLLGQGIALPSGTTTHEAAGPNRVFVEGVPATRLTPITTTKMVQETQVRKVPYTVNRVVTEVVSKQVPTTVTKMVPTTVCKTVPTTTCRIVTEQAVKQVPTKVTVMKPEVVCKKVATTVCTQVPCTTTVKVPYTYTENVAVCVPKKIAIQVPVNVMVRKPRYVATSPCGNNPCATSAPAACDACATTKAPGAISGLVARIGSRLPGGSGTNCDACALAPAAPVRVSAPACSTAAADPCAPGLASVITGNSNEPVRDLLRSLFKGRLCADPCAPVVAPTCSTGCK
jgi:hypothetical protein